MTQFQQLLTILGALFALVVIVAGIWVAFRAAAQDARIKRLQGERDDYLSRLNYIEPRLSKAEEQNKVLLELHNPADQIEALRAQEQNNHDRTVTILQEQSVTLAQIDSRLPRSGGD